MCVPAGVDAAFALNKMPWLTEERRKKGEESSREEKGEEKRAAVERREQQWREESSSGATLGEAARAEGAAGEDQREQQPRSISLR